MARQTLTKTTPLGSLPSLPLVADSADIVFTSADATNKEQFVASGNDLVIAWNSGVSTRTVTLTSVALNGRTGDISTYSLGAGDHAVFGPFQVGGWRQTDGKIYLEASHSDVKWAIIALP